MLFSQLPAYLWTPSHLSLFQDNVLNIINQIMDVCIPQDRAPRDFCVKFPEEIRHDNLAGQLWFGAEVAAVAWVQGHGIGIDQPFLCEPWADQKHDPECGVWGAPVGWAGRGQESHDRGAVGLWGPSHRKSLCDRCHDCSGFESNPGKQVPMSWKRLPLREQRGLRPGIPGREDL